MMSLHIRFANMKNSEFRYFMKFGSFLCNLQRIARLHRWRHCIFLSALFFCMQPSVRCNADVQSFRSKARQATDRLRGISPPPKLMEEYENILSTFDDADELSLSNKTDEAEEMYRLVILKSEILNKKLPPLGTSAAEKQTLATPSDFPGDMNWNQPRGDTPIAYSGSKKDRSQPKGIPPSGGAETGAEVTSPQQAPPVMEVDSPDYAITGEDGRIEDDEVEINPVSSSLMVGKEFFYTVKKHESLRMIGAKLGVGWRTIARENDLDPKKPLESGQELVINTRRIIPKTLRNGILINIPDRTLYLFKKKKLETAVPVALGMPTCQDYGDWRTPTGRFRILSKMKNPTWHVPPSIQTEMKQTRRKVVTKVPPSSGNPLGKFALKTSLSGILIHSTIHPESIYHFASHGCIRVNPKNMEEIFPEIPVHTEGEIVYQPVKLAFSDDGRVFIEVHGDIYKRFKKLDDVARELIVKNNAERLVDWGKVRALLRRKSGIPEDVSLYGPGR